MKTNARPAKIELPTPIIEADTKYPEYQPGRKSLRDGEYADLPPCVTLYLVTGRRLTDEWVICTLPISGKGRTYGQVIATGAGVRVGAGPHVKATVTLYFTADNVERLKPIIDLYRKGLIEANVIRDRISSRRAEGNLRRARGEISWRWDS